MSSSCPDRSVEGREKKARAFSLIELLVVIAILALLLGLLIPGLRHARSAAQRATCASNIRQIALANVAYSNDNHGRLAPGASNFIENLDRWYGHRDSVHESFEPKEGPLSPYLGPDGAVRRCPTFDPDRSQPGADFEAGNGGYGYNNVYLGVDERMKDTRGAKHADIDRPFETVMLTDAAFAQPYPTLRVIEYSFAEPVYQRRNDSFELDPSIHFRHANKSNVAWADGHVDPRPFEFTRGNIYGVSEDRMRDLDIGWFGPESNRFFDLE